MHQVGERTKPECTNKVQSDRGRFGGIGASLNQTLLRLDSTEFSKNDLPLTATSYYEPNYDYHLVLRPCPWWCS
jgi:hypothetical protein